MLGHNGLAVWADAQLDSVAISPDGKAIVRGFAPLWTSPDAPGPTRTITNQYAP